jgi:class 3 adenylate cyclase
LSGLCRKISIIPVTAFLAGILLPGAMGHLLLQRYAVRETHEKAVALLSTLEAMRLYVEEPPSAKSSSVATTGGNAPAGKALAAVIQRYHANPRELNYKYHLAYAESDDPAHKPDPFATRIITTFQADPRLRRVEEEVQLPDGSHLAVAVPVKRADRLVGAAVVYVPTDYSRQQAMRIFWVVGIPLSLLSGICCVLLLWRLKRLVIVPVQQMRDTCLAIRRGEWTARFPKNPSDELEGLSASFQETTRWLRERIAQEEKLRALFQQFVPASVAAKALGREADKVLEGTVQPVTVMVINIRNFKLLMDHLPPQETVATLNEFFTQVNRVIVSHKGLVSKYLGDTVLAFFGVPQGSETHELDAVRAALEIPRALQNLYVRLDEEYGWQLGVGIGISSGQPIVGHFGSSEHYEYTVLGGVVQEAHWLEEISKGVPEEDTIVISEPTFRRVMSEVHVYDLGERTTAAGKTLHAFAVQGLRMEARSALAA